MRHARLLLRLADAARNLGVNSFVVSGLAAQQAAKSEDGVAALRLRKRAGSGRNLPRARDANDLDIRLGRAAALEGVRAPLRGAAAGSGRNLPRARDANDLDIRLDRAAAVEGVERTLQQAVGDNGIPASDHNRELHTGGGQVAFDGDGLAMQRILRLPEAENERWIECDREEARIPVRGRNVGEQLGNLFGAVVGDHPLLDNRMNLVELGNLDEDRRCGWHATGNQLEVADGREEGRATSAAILPALAGLEATRPKEAGELVERSRRSDRRHQRDSLDHVSIVSSAFSGRLAAGRSEEH